MTLPISYNTRHSNRGRLISLSCSLSLFCLSFIVSLLYGKEWLGQILIGLDRLRDLGALGWCAFVGVQAFVALIGFLPASLLGIAAGAVYGVWIGFILSSFGVLAGAVIAFWLARSTFRSTIKKFTERRSTLNRLDNAITRDGWRFILLMRVSPLMPFSLTSFALGLSGVRFGSYVIGTIASLPALFLYVTIGTLGVNGINSAQHGTTLLHIIFLAIGIIATIFLTLRIGSLFTRALHPRA